MVRHPLHDSGVVSTGLNPRPQSTTKP